MNPNVRFFISILFIPFLLLVDNSIFSWIITLVFLILVGFKKKRIKILPPLFLILSIVFFSILQPTGKILFSLGSFHITLGSILFGLEKSGKLLAMLYISQYAISRDLHIKGEIGEFLNTVFSYFDTLSEHKKNFNIKKPIESIDEILIEVYKG